MTKAGEPYNDLAAELAAALQPGAVVTANEWVSGPDGEREADVLVRGTIEGSPHLILIECKDWKRPVDVKAIDELESKSRDLGADRVIIASNSGFSHMALRKAERTRIEAVSIMAAGDRRVRVKVWREKRVKFLSVGSWTMRAFPTPESEKDFEGTWQPNCLRRDGMPVQNWVHQLSSDLLVRYQPRLGIAAYFSFGTPASFELEQKDVQLTAFEVVLYCSSKWMYQVLCEHVSLGYYDHVRKRVTVPSGEFWSQGPIDSEAWLESESQDDPEPVELEPGSFQFDLTGINAVPLDEHDTRVPDIDAIVTERRLSVDERLVTL